MIPRTTPIEIEFDTCAALERLGGDRGLLGDVMDVVIEDSLILLSTIESTIAANAFEEVERASHSLRGLVSNVSCEAVREAAWELEQAARARDAAQLAQLMPGFHRIVRDMRARLIPLRRDFSAA